MKNIWLSTYKEDLSEAYKLSYGFEGVKVGPDSIEKRLDLPLMTLRGG
jgi:hypothetical protein